MGFSLRCVIATAADADEAASLIAALTAALPHTRGRAFERPFPGVLVGHHPDELHDALEAEPARFSETLARLRAADEGLTGDDDDELAAALDWLISILLGDASRALPDKPLAYVEVECFGGVCMYRGELVRAGERVWAVDALAQDGHQQLLARLGVGELAWHFPPFERGFLAGADVGTGDPAERRRPIRAVVEGWIAGLSLARLGPILFVGLADSEPAWSVRPMGAMTILLSAGADDLAMSINASAGEGHDLGGRCHVTPAEAEGPLAQLAELLGDFGADYELILASYPDRAPIRRWAP